jgi:hypothetical protein
VRAVVVLAAAVAVALASGALVLVTAEASPPPGAVLAAAKRYVRPPRSLTYTAHETVSAPAGAGALLVRPRAVHGTGTAGGAADFSVNVGSLTFEYRIVDGGIWGRGTPGAPSVLGTGWVHAGSLAAFERAVLGYSGVSSPAASDIAQAVLLDEISSPATLRALVGNATAARRHGTSVRTIDVVYEPAAVLGPGAGVDSMSGVLGVDADGRPRHLTVAVRAGTTTVDASYDVAWGGLVTITPPAPTDVVSSV